MDDQHKANEFKIVDIITPTRLVLNCGEEQGVKVGDRFQVYAHGKMIVDPDTGAEIEPLEVPRGPGRVIYVQRKLCTVESTSTTYRTVKREAESPYLNVLKSIGGLTTFPAQTETETISVRAPFDDPQIGDRARFIGSERVAAPAVPKAS